MVVHPDPPERVALRAALDSGNRIRVVGLAGDGWEALALARRLRPIVILMDDRARAPDDTDLLRALARRSEVIMLTHLTERHALVALLLCAPVRGCLVHGHFEPPDLTAAVQAVAAGLGWLSPIAAAEVASALRGPVGATRILGASAAGVPVPAA
ncbi:hypothetical protein [Micromonospora sp. KLBMP9576]|uniref:hypothetical protein n=1 Tax=Micromonospora sp. KLBMP9576 TaxID=3424769 RepID=UPI003D947F11